MALLIKILALALGLLVLGAVFWGIEHRWPAMRGQKLWRREIGTDIAYWFFTPVVTQAATGVATVLAAIVVASALGGGTRDGGIAAFVHRSTAVKLQPLWLQGVEGLVLSNFVLYWCHRLFHSRPVLWRFHAIHHSSRQLDWLSSVRVHPVNDALMKMVQAAVLLAVGFDLPALAFVVPFFTFYALLLHANVGWTLGPLGRFFVSPAFHRWHHTTEQEGLNKNFAGLFPWIDMLFGTFYMPKGRQPESFGILGSKVPSGLVPQLVWPFRRPKASAPA